jgi:hypothetical protein
MRKTEGPVTTAEQLVFTNRLSSFLPLDPDSDDGIGPTLSFSRGSGVLLVWLGESDISDHLSRAIQSFESGRAVSTELQHSTILFVRIL